MRNVYTVKQINTYVKNMFAQDFILNRIYVRGEVSNCKYHSSGHIYFSLKDESGVIACVMFAGSRAGLSFDIKEGQQVVVLGSVSVYERDGRYQLYAKEIILDGVGLLHEKFQALKEELAEMGMFAPEYKQPIPAYIKTLGVVTAKTGAVIQDIIQVAKRRNPYVEIILYPAKVQGEGAAESIVKGIKLLEEIGVDVMIIGRGGGSIEDLWAFNEEKVARGIFDCTIPIISAVGHETDTTIADFVADERAPTPSAAAEIAVYEYLAVKNYIGQEEARLKKNLYQVVDKNKGNLKQLSLRIKHGHPRQKLNEKRQYLVDLEGRIYAAVERNLTKNKHILSIWIEKFKGLSPLYKLNQGYVYMEDKDKKNIRSVSQVKVRDVVDIYLADGKIKTKVEDIIQSSKRDKKGKEKL